MESVVPWLIGFLVCVAAVAGFVYTLEKEYDCSYARSKDQGALVMAFLMGVFLIWLVFSGRYSDPGRMSYRPYKPYGYPSKY